MKCHNCGEEINTSYCSNCGTKNDYLPRSINFLLVLVILFLIMIFCGLFLIINNNINDYKSYISVENNKIYYPIGYKTEINKDKGQECGYIYDKYNTYVFCFVNSKYSSYKLNDYQYIKEYLKEQEYTMLDSKEYNDNLLLFKLNSKDKSNNYLYVYDFKDKGVVTGNYVKNGEVTEKDIERLQKILKKINK